ncbi:hypothetical protein D8Y24_05610 [Agrococcus lahaulensis]|nr:hypothetical protein D8Y24_05610 [Agrococcus lahaulensis]
MRRRLRSPRDIDAFGRLVAALRVHLEQRHPANDAERAIAESMRANDVPVDAARRMLQTLDAMPRRALLSLLGDVADSGFVPAERTPERPERTAQPVTLTVSSTVLARLGRLIDTGAVAAGDVREEMLDEQTDAPPVYTINYRGLWCEDETTWDWVSWADEIYVITSAVHVENGENVVRTERHPVADDERWYEDVDSDEARLGPIAACWHGRADTVSLTAVVMEHDMGDPDAYREEIDALVKAALAVLAYFYPPAALAQLLSSTITDAVNWLLDTADDPIETQTVVHSSGMLEALSTSYRGTYLGEGQRHTGLEYHFLTNHAGGGARYVLGFEVLRDPEHLPEGPFL